VCENSVLPSVRLQRALIELHKVKPLHSKFVDVECWAAQMGHVMRAAMSAYRALKKDDVARSRCFSKAARIIVHSGGGGGGSSCSRVVCVCACY
jgi:hypothetical protein